MNGDVLATVLTGAAVLVAVWRMVESVRRDLSNQITNQIADVRADLRAINARIDAVLLADRSKPAA